MKCNKKGCVKRLSVCGLSGAFGIASALSVLVVGLLAKYAGVGLAWVNMAASLYVGFGTTPKGLVIGVVWAFVDGIIFGIIVGVVYNFILRHCPCKTCRTDDEVKKE